LSSASSPSRNLGEEAGDDGVDDFTDNGDKDGDTGLIPPEEDNNSLDDTARVNDGGRCGEPRLN